ncbi:adaptor protein MecA [Salipaludibacillus agaradhaerens]|uniref:Adaptor protein MecA n=1 Tax=Salipaludibacillus agaradhaerens TaxID=76935 RepID=A0A9Q4B1C6_SALAG|nr:adaptor protein MecA [Salipaludibacillus agaradhaerens]MCR6096546.1 adaptor protein MecA [Salipaludibacillus agaradhaerens]MCR6113895.1 adaptor protein MecA [Salipaludibacillus agaradhaerens]
MRLERLAYDKMKISLSYEDLEQRGISTDKAWSDVPVIDELFQEMITEASEELNFEPEGPVVVEVFSIPSQGLVIIVTKTEDVFDDAELPFMQWEAFETKTHDAKLFKFNEFEDVIQLCKTLYTQNIQGGKLFHYRQTYYLAFGDKELPAAREKTIYAICCEFGEPANLSVHKLNDYGKIIVPSQAIKRITTYFS